METVADPPASQPVSNCLRPPPDLQVSFPGHDEIVEIDAKPTDRSLRIAPEQVVQPAGPYVTRYLGSTYERSRGGLPEVAIPAGPVAAAPEVRFAVTALR